VKSAETNVAGEFSELLNNNIYIANVKRKSQGNRNSLENYDILITAREYLARECLAGQEYSAQIQLAVTPLVTVPTKQTDVSRLEDRAFCIST
jgi:hypothetical protein